MASPRSQPNQISILPVHQNKIIIKTNLRVFYSIMLTSCHKSMIAASTISPKHIPFVAHCHGNTYTNTKTNISKHEFFGNSRSLLITSQTVVVPRSTSSTNSTIVAAASNSKNGTIAVTGATGLIGTRLVDVLTTQGYNVRVLTRNPSTARMKLRNTPGLEFFAPSQWASAIKGTTAVINLAGEPIATRWTPELKAEIKRSRVRTTSALVDAINALPESERPQVLISSSAVGYYGTNDSSTFNESSEPGNDYLAEVCKEWEAAAVKAQTRVVVLRTGIVLAKEGGALAKMIPVFQIFAGGPLGSGKQWCSWIHRDDIIGMILAAIQDSNWSGTYNATAPNPVRMGELCSELGSAMGRPSFFPVPDFALQALLGDGATVVLDGQRVLPARAQDAGYRFRYAKVGDALKNVLRE